MLLYNSNMTELHATSSYSRKVTLDDFLCDDDDENDCKNHQSNYNNNNNRSYSDNDYIQKNQQHYGPRKRIKP